jgi:hypothetical protein
MPRSVPDQFGVMNQLGRVNSGGGGESVDVGMGGNMNGNGVGDLPFR